jgi:hypothetical protein
MGRRVWGIDLPVTFGLAAAIAAAAAITGAAPAAASVPGLHSSLPMEFSAQRRIRRIATRIEVYPNTRRVRRCVDWYAIEHRQSGNVITPHMRCWWAAR